MPEEAEHHTDSHSAFSVKGGIVFFGGLIVIFTGMLIIWGATRPAAQQTKWETTTNANSQATPTPASVQPSPTPSIPVPSPTPSTVIPAECTPNVLQGALSSPFGTTRRIGFLANSPSNLGDVFSRANALHIDLIVHVGDFEPSLDIQSIIGSIETFSFVPVLVAAGDRDVAQISSWYSLAQGLATVYQNVNLGNLELFCTGNVGLATTCLWNGVGFVVSSIGLDVCPSSFAQSYIQSKLNELDANHAQIKFCVFHRGNSLMNIDDDPNNYTSISVYDTCRQAGAVVVTGNSHQSAITRVMSSFAASTIAANQTITKGQSVSAVVGLGGQAAVSANAQKASQAKWSYTKDTGAELLVATINSTQVSFSYQSLISLSSTFDGVIPPAFTYAYTH